MRGADYFSAWTVLLFTRFPGLVALLFSWTVGAWCVSSAALASPVTQDEWLTLADGVFAHIVGSGGNAVSNAGVVILEHGVLVFDTHFTAEGAQGLLARIRSATPKQVRYVVNSHYHPDHTHGNSVFSSAACFISSGNARRDILQKDLPVLNRSLSAVQAQLESLRKSLASASDAKQKEALRGGIASREDYLARMSGLKIPVPPLTLDDSLELGDGREIRILFLGPAHTDGDIVLYLPWAKVVFAGDIFFNGALPNTQDAAILGWIKTLQELLGLDAEKYVPGHGPVGSKREVAAFLQYFEDLKTLVGQAVQRGDPLDQVVRELKVPEKYSSWGFQNFFPANVQRLYVELKALQPPSAEAGRKAEPPKP